MDEKSWVAFTSVIAAIILTVTKLIVGIMTNSIGILSEALHSALDLVAAGMTLFAVRTASKPADYDHPYGHGKIENLSALIETILLAVTVIWIIYEASRRIILDELKVETSPIAFGVIIFAIIIDYSRSRALYKTAKKYDSQALQADALHFSTDILSSSVVLAGLLFTYFGFPLGDPIAAIVVAIIVMYLTAKLGRETVDYLLDRAPLGLTERICATVEGIEGVTSCGRIRVRKSGHILFVDAEIHADPNLPLEKAHQIGSRAEFAIEKLLGPADVMIHMHPEMETCPLVIESIRKEAKKFDWIKDIHNILALEFKDQATIVLHIEMNPKASIGEAHQLITEFEAYLKQNYPLIKEIITHIEPFTESKDYPLTVDILKEQIQRLIRKERLLQNCHDITVFPMGDGYYHLAFHCDTDSGLSVLEVHNATKRLEADIRENLPVLSQIVIHVEPLSEKLLQ